MITYKKTANPNIILKIETIESEIYLDKLQADIDTLQEQMSSIPKPKETPDQETLDCWNERNLMSFDTEELDEKKTLLKTLTELKIAK